jgi:hypothetical protein
MQTHFGVLAGRFRGNRQLADALAKLQPSMHVKQALVDEPPEVSKIFEEITTLFAQLNASEGAKKAELHAYISTLPTSTSAARARSLNELNAWASCGALLTYCACSSARILIYCNQWSPDLFAATMYNSYFLWSARAPAAPRGLRSPAGSSARDTILHTNIV